jgi:hypothetical protein
MRYHGREAVKEKEKEEMKCVSNKYFYSLYCIGEDNNGLEA